MRIKKYCSQCGTELDIKDLFCLECGTKVEEMERDDQNKKSTEHEIKPKTDISETKLKNSLDDRSEAGENTFLQDKNKTFRSTQINQKEENEKKIKQYINLADMELKRINKSALTRILLWGTAKNDFSNVEYFLNEALKLGSKEAESKLLKLKLRKFIRL